VDAIFPDRLPIESDWLWYKNRWGTSTGEMVDGDSIPTVSFHNRSMREIIAIAAALGANPESTYGSISDRFNYVVHNSETLNEYYIPVTASDGTVVNSTVYYDGDTVIINNDFETNNITVNNDMTVTNNLTVNNDITAINLSIIAILVEENITTGGDITTSGNITVEGDTIIEGDTNIYGPTTIYSPTYINSTLNTTQSLIVGTNLTASGNVYAGGSFTSAGAHIINITIVNESEYTTLDSDHILHVIYSASGTTNIILPDSICTEGRILVVKDAAGNASERPITIDPEDTTTIDGESSIDININYMSLSIYSDGSDWFIY